uniref:Uncharacterized protein n=1 Tax=Hyaloperonospora arabidopsidis (strain Emoy2) TaxID=559515 RepID=M4B9A3_HYAAE
MSASSRVIVGHGHRINTLALNVDYVCRPGLFGYKTNRFASREEMQHAALKRYEEMRNAAGEPLELFAGRAYFASTSFDKKVKIWNGHTGKFVTTLTGHVGAVYQVCWSSDTRLIVTASKDSTVKVWELGNLKKILARCATKKDTVMKRSRDEIMTMEDFDVGTTPSPSSLNVSMSPWKPPHSSVKRCRDRSVSVGARKPVESQTPICDMLRCTHCEKTIGYCCRCECDACRNVFALCARH